MKNRMCLALALWMSAGAMAQVGSGTPDKADPKSSRKELRVAARNLAVEVRAPLTDDERAIALRVQVGTLPCELGQVVMLTPDPGSAGYFNLRFGKENYHVSPLETTTGAIRLEDKAAGVVWLQLANKSMLMSQKQGRRLADECMSPAQTLVAQAMLKNPLPSLLDDAAPAGVAKPVGDLPGQLTPEQF